MATNTPVVGLISDYWRRRHVADPVPRANVTPGLAERGQRYNVKKWRLGTYDTLAQSYVLRVSKAISVVGVCFRCLLIQIVPARFHEDIGTLEELKKHLRNLYVQFDKTFYLN